MLWFTRVASQASVSNGLALALAFYWPSFATGVPRALLLIGVTLALTIINLQGIRQSKWVVNGLTIGKLTPLLLFIAFGIWFIDPARLTTLPDVTIGQVGTAALLLIFAYGGYEVTGVPAGEASNPRRDVPFAFVMTIVTVAAVMSLTSVVATGLLPDLAATRTPLADGATVFMGALGALVVSVGAVLSMTGNNMGQVLSGSRTIFALAENHDLPRWFAHVHPAQSDAVERDPVHVGGRAHARAHRLVRAAGGGERGRAAGDVSGGLHGDARPAPPRTGRHDGSPRSSRRRSVRWCRSSRRWSRSAFSPARRRSNCWRGRRRWPAARCCT